MQQIVVDKLQQMAFHFVLQWFWFTLDKIAQAPWFCEMGEWKRKRRLQGNVDVVENIVLLSLRKENQKLILINF